MEGYGGVKRPLEQDAPNASKKRSRFDVSAPEDARGRFVDDRGNVVEQERRQVSTLRVNDPNRQVTAEQSVTRSDRPVAPPPSLGPGGRANPYLAHRLVAASAGGSGKAEGDVAGGDARTLAVVGAAEAEAKRRRRADRSLHFVSQGAYSAAGDEMRAVEAAKAAALALRQRGGRNKPMYHAEVPPVGGTRGEGGDAPAGEASGAAPLPSRPPPSTVLPPKARLPPPDVEWWDAAFLPAPRAKLYKQQNSTAGRKAAHAVAAAAAKGGEGGGEGGPTSTTAPLPVPFSYAELAPSACNTVQYVQHPPPITPLADPDAATGGQPLSIPLMLTKEERRKVRRQQRAEKHKFMLDQQKLGLLPAPEPRVRLANMMRVLKDAAVADPSAVEARVRAQMAARVQTHEENNNAKMLKPEERLEKKKRKMGRHGPSGPDAAVFRVCDLSHGRARFKVDVGAREHFLGGIALLAKTAGVCLVYVEGGTKAVARYVKIMAKVDWKRSAKDTAARVAREAKAGVGGKDDGDAEEDDDSDDEEEEDEEDSDEEEEGGGGGSGARGYGPGGLCELVWRGTSPKRFFTDFSFEECRSSATARRLMETKGLAHLWDAVSHSEHARRVGAGEEADALEEGGAGGGRGGEAGLLSTGLFGPPHAPASILPALPHGEASRGEGGGGGGPHPHVSSVNDEQDMT